MKMHADDCRVYSIGDSMMVVATFAGMGRDWPDTLVDKTTGTIYIFQSNEPMQDWMIGNYSGHAKYIKVVHQP